MTIVSNNLKQMQAARVRQGFVQECSEAFKERKVLEDQGFNARASEFDDNLSAVGQRAFMDLSD